MIGFVVLHYLTSEYTIKTVNSIIDNVKEKKIITIVDNASPNGSLEKLKEKYCNNPEIDFLSLNDNLGFAKGNNAGYKHIKDNYMVDFIVVLNNDVLLTQADFYNLVVKSYETNKFDVLGPDIYSIRDSKHQNPARMSNFTLKDLKNKRVKIIIKLKLKLLIYLKWKLLTNLKTTNLDYKISKDGNLFKKQKTINNVVLHGSIYVFSKRFIKKEDECFYSGTFMYMESFILHYLSTLKGYKLVFDPSIKVLHFEDVATDISSSTKYQKAVITLNRLLDATNEFISVMEGNGE